MKKLRQLTDLGQSIWVDYIRRSFIEEGDLQDWIDKGVCGLTSNPSIFEKAIAGSADYDDDLQMLVQADKSVDEIYEALVLDDISRVADLLRPIYDRTYGADGYVSLEVDPGLAHDTAGTVSAARRLFAILDRPNVMIKVPATVEGIPAIETLIGEGINVNATLIFSLNHYEAVAEAFISGLEKYAVAGGDLSSVASVASLFVSRADRTVDSLLEERDEACLLGKIAIANTRMTYARFREIFSGERWERLAQDGARVQRPLWASTSTKSPMYPDTLYVDSLIGADTVNTVPLGTLNAFLDHGKVAVTIDTQLDEARADLERLSELGIDLGAVTQKLQDDGVMAFAKSFETLMASIGEKRNRLVAGWKSLSETLGSYQEAVDAAVTEIADGRVLARIWAHDHTVWKPDPAEISNRLGWLHTVEIMLQNVPRLEALAEDVRADGYTHALLLGMGGSSLAPELFSKAFGSREGYLDLAVLDSTDPGAVLAQVERLDLKRTLFIVATKSGGTVETLSFFKFFYNRLVEEVGASRAGEHFVAITDPGSKLVDLAHRYAFRMTFLNDPNIGGRYSVLSYFGLVPAALIGIDLSRLLGSSGVVACCCEASVVARDSTAVRLGVILSEMTKAGRDKVTFFVSPAVASFGDWVEQLLAESTGKEGKGIIPVVGEIMGLPEVYGQDRLFVQIRLADDVGHDDGLAALEKVGHPVVRLHLRDIYDLGGQIFLWEMATVIASYGLGINPFDQPNVEAAKVLARKMVAGYIAEGELPRVDSASPSSDALDRFLSQARPGDYVSLQAYLQPTPETAAELADLRMWLRDRTGLATTVGFGPRFLHSTGQLHKGDGGHGLFIQLTADDPRDVAIPDEAGSPASSITFGLLKEAQALGDQRALLDVDRRVIRFHLGQDVLGGLQRLLAK